MKSMKLLSSTKKSSRPSSAAPSKPPPPSSSGNKNSNGPMMNESLLQLQLENTHLRSKLDALLNTDESKSELLSLLQQQTLDNEQLQQKVQMLNSGVVEIDKERKRLVKAAHSAQVDLDMLRHQHAEVSQHLQMREMEIDSLVDRVREQERRLESASADNSELTSQLAQVNTLLEESEYELKEKEHHWHEEKNKLDQELADRDDQISSLSQDLSTSTKLNEEQSRTIDNLEQSLTNMRAELNKVQLHHAQTLDKMEEELENERHARVETLEKLTSAREHFHKENGDLVEELQRAKNDYSLLQEDHRVSVEAVNKLTIELEEERQSHFDAQEQFCATKEQFEKENNHLVEELQKIKTDYASLQEDHLASDESIKSLVKEMEDERQLHVATQEELMATKEQLEKEANDLAEELQTTKDQLQTTQNEYRNVNTAHEQLQQDQTSLEKKHSELQQENLYLNSQIDTKNTQIDTLNTESENQQSQSSARIISLEKALDDEKATANKFRSQLRELNLQLKENDNATSNEMRTLERELEEARQKYETIIVNHQDEIQSVQKQYEDELEEVRQEYETVIVNHEEEVQSMQKQYEDELEEVRRKYETLIVNHEEEIQSMQKQHEEELVDFETRGADVISDLEDTITSLEKEIMEGKMGNEESVNKLQQDLSRANMEQNRLNRIITEHERKEAEQQEKIEALSLYGKQRKEEAKTLQSELERVQDEYENQIREKDGTMASLRSEQGNISSIHEKEMTELRITIEDIKGQLVSAKSTLSDRTNLIRDMVEQTKAYQNDLERERSRAVQLEEAVRSYKKQLTEARNSSNGLEEEIHEKDTQYCEAIRNERNQRKSVEAELESFRLSMEDALRRRNEMEKENVALKDKVQRQEKYIGRLQNRDKQNRRQSNAPRTSYMAGVEKEPPRLRIHNPPVHTPLRAGSKIGVGLKQYQPRPRSSGTEENTRPNLSRRMMDENFTESSQTEEVARLS